MSISAWDINVSMLFSLLLANIEILSCFFFLFFVIFSNFLTVPVVIEKIKVKLALSIPTNAPIILVNEIIDTPPLAALKTIKTFSMKSKAVKYLFNSLLHDFLSLISC